MKSAADKVTVEVAKRISEDGNDGVAVSSTGYRIRYIPVAAMLLEKVTTSIKYPEVPIYKNEDKGIEEENPNDPAYIRACAAVDADRGNAALNALIMFGVVLEDEIPPDETWYPRLKYVGIEINLEDPIERELMFKKYVVMGSKEIIAVGRLSGMEDDAIETAAASFQGVS